MPAEQQAHIPRGGEPSGRRSDTGDLVALLRSSGRRVTSQRLVILRELRRRARHATAEEIYAAVRGELPGISIPTIYAVADLLVELGLARKLDVGVGMALYDARAEPHQHTVCRRCGAVEDLEGSFPSAGLTRAARARGFRPEGVEAVVRGLCARCEAADRRSGPEAAAADSAGCG